MAHMQGPIGVGRAVVQGEGLARVLLAQALVEPLLGPERLDFRLAHLGIGPHRKGRLQEVERLLVGEGVGDGRRAGGHVAWGQQN